VTGYAEQANTFPKASRHGVESFREGDLAAVLLDMDGTLIEHTRDLHDVCRETFAAFEEELAPVTQESFWETFWPRNRDMWYMMVDGVLSGDVARLYFMDFVLISEEAGVHKPEKAIFDQALGKAETTAERSLFVGDTPSTDIDGARKAGLHAVLMDPRDKWVELEGAGVPAGVPKIRRLGELPLLLGLPETKRA
jgi:FMN phosphatase YigB (HAD superfamily)